MAIENLSGDLPVPARKIKAQPLRLYLFEAGTEFSACIEPSEGLRKYRVPNLGIDEANLIVAEPPRSKPRWVNMLQPHTTGTLGNLTNKSVSAVLLFCSRDRLFAATFGHGRHLLDLDRVEFDFGLKVVLNRVAESRLRSVDAKTIDENALQTRRHTGRDSAFEAFGLDVSHDLVSGVTGTPDVDTLFTRFSGADSLACNVRLHPELVVPELPRLGGELLDAYGDNRYKEQFEFVDHFRPEKSAKRLEELNERLVSDLKANNLSDLHLAAPEIVDPFQLDGYMFDPKGSAELQVDPRISSYLELRRHEEITFELLKRDRLVALGSADDRPLGRWSIYRSLVYEVEIDDKLFALSGGKWFRVDLDYKNEVVSSLQNLPSRADLPESSTGWSEETYNKEASHAMGALCMDKRLIVDGGSDKMEVCDILTSDGAFLHVKKRGSSSTLSHLFFQAINSADRLLGDQNFRAKARSQVAELEAEFAGVIPIERPDPTLHEVGLVILTRSSRDSPFTLPFFSLVSLRETVRRLKVLGFNVTVTAVRETTST